MSNSTIFIVTGALVGIATLVAGGLYLSKKPQATSST